VSPPTFDPHAFCVKLGEQLVTELADAGSATTPGLMGAAREHRLRERLTGMLPGGVAVGSGCLIDTNGQTSRQQDIVVYERHLCPVFSVADLDEASYFPCEGVAAVGEVKSTLDRDQLADALKKVRSVRDLQRRAVASEGLVGVSVPFRPYGSRAAMHGTPDESFNQTANYLDRTLGFVVFRTLRMSAQRLIDDIADAAAEHGPDSLPALLVGINDGVLVFTTPSLTRTLDVRADSIAAFNKVPSPFVDLVQNLRGFIRLGRTTEVRAFDHYFRRAGEPPGDVAAMRPLSD
jgi:hypothetical protein